MKSTKRALDLDIMKLHQGLTKREWFAGIALQTLIHDTFISSETKVQRAVEFADLLIEKLKEKK
jgi:hypothetical protein